MTSKFAIALVSAAAAILAPLSMALAVDTPTTVTVALLDMSATMGHGRMGQGMGHGMGGSDAGSGMMGRGHGMMRPGGGMMGGGPNMQGMGMMSIRLDKSTVKAGDIHFVVTNWSRGMLHEMIVVPVDHADAPMPYDYDSARIPEKQIKSLGEVSELQPNKTGTIDLKLAAGTYLLICNVPGHYAAGMVTPLTVTP